MSRHNYTNPAFCQDEAPVRTIQATPVMNVVKNSPARVHRSDSIRSFHSVASTNRSLRSGMQRMNSGLSLNCSHHQQHSMPLSLPPRTAPKPISQRIVDGGNVPVKQQQAKINNYGSISDVHNQSVSGRYALVPVEELSSQCKGRYAVLPPQTASRFISKSQENLDTLMNTEDDDELPHNYSDQFTSLPPISSPKKESNGMMPAFSTDFGSKSFILFDQKNHQRYAVVPTEENEEIVDDNHEIIQMHNGKAHRYAVIPTDEEETCLNSDSVKPPPVPPSYAMAISRRTSPQRTPQKQLIQQQKTDSELPSTPKKNPIATQKLYELLSTPQKTSPFVRQNSTPLTPKNSPYRIKAHHASNPRLASRHEFTPQRLDYDQKVRMASTTTLNVEQRTTAVIQPRVHTAASIYNETTTTLSTSTEKSWNKNLKSHKHAIATIGFVSLLLMFCGVINSGLCIYMTSVSSISALYTGRSYFLDIGILSAFATVALSFLGFKYRHSDWLPNRNYISGFIMMTLFAISNCCALVVLLLLKPIKGTPLHDVATGISLALSLLILLLISLGVISSRLCRSPPPDNRIDIF
ncbi:hypothetical protein PVAND_006223 [Polypedilum vanderplanki]|uniref:Uncharacterized protein n=1 Tax=Polypedilum vanderplanki TaxID=319348 RepID=A0A9J6C4B3_POLVA|nr:hypothetical protein PVAND_006223 [Polypedilum vanderplanki]